MKIDKNPIVTASLMVAVVIVLIAATLLLSRQKDREDDREQIETTDPGQSASTSEGGGIQTTPSPSDVPDIDANQSDYAKPYDALDVSSMSPTTLTKEEVTESVADLLDGLLRLDTESIERVSPKSTGGEHNPFRVMLNAALADEELKAAFINMGGRSSYEILDVSVSTNSPNVYTVIISASTPYMASLAPELAAGEQLMYVQELTRLKASGAAQAIAEMDLSTIPLSTDIVTLAILVEDDVPVLYYPTSLTYGGEIPQYAFLWGAIEFQGTNNGDLLLRNDYGAGTEVTVEEFYENGKCKEFALYINAALGNINKTDICDKARTRIAKEARGKLKAISKPTDDKNEYEAVRSYAAYVMGVHNYYRMATNVCLDFGIIAFSLKKTAQCQLRERTTRSSENPSLRAVMERYGKSKQLRFVSNHPIAPIGYVQTKPPMSKKRSVQKYTPEGREEIHKNLGIDTRIMLELMRQPVYGNSVKFADNRISLYSGQNGKCAVTGRVFESAEEIHCHHKNPREDGGTDDYENLMLILKDVHILVHATIPETIGRYLSALNLTGRQKLKLNKLRVMAGNETIA